MITRNESRNEITKDLLIEDLQEIDKRFDIVVSSEVIEHVEEPWAFTAYCSNLVKEDGDLIMTTVNRTQVRSSTILIGRSCPWTSRYRPGPIYFRKRLKVIEDICY